MMIILWGEETAKSSIQNNKSATCKLNLTSRYMSSYFAYHLDIYWNTRPFFINCLPGLTELQINMHQEGSLLLIYFLYSLKLNRNIPVIKTKSLKSVISSTIEVSAWILAVQSLLSWPRCSGQVVSVGVCFTLKAADTNCGASCSMSPAMLLTVCTPFKLKKKNDKRSWTGTLWIQKLMWCLCIHWIYWRWPNN